ncbi:hypothetical protein IQ07DRAFT_680206 [Pyrenochaeta sp. DS3sAY3a]|nr:hypothetical protein IQ07DRAFT_680206 [Pyrenochaeta sp. DS3sAY3a]
MNSANSSQSQAPLNIVSQSSSSLVAPSAPSPIIITLSDYTAGLPSLRSLSSRLSLSSSSKASASITPTTFTAPRFTYAPYPESSGSVNVTSSSPVLNGSCTGCVLQAYRPVTTFFEEDDEYNPWTSTVVTETIVTHIITYFVGTIMDGITTSEETVNQTKTVIGEWNETITATTPQFVIQPTPGVYLTVDAGPTYVIYNDIVGGLDRYIDRTYSLLKQTLRTCAPTLSALKHWEPTATEDWSYFVETFTEAAPERTTYLPAPLPSQLVEFLKQDPDIVSQFGGSDIATCTQRRPDRVEGTPKPPPAYPSAPAETRPEEETATETVPATAPFESVTTGTFISTKIETTSTHVTRQGCLRCENTKPNDNPGPGPTDGPISNKINDNTPAPTYKPDDPNKPNDPNRPDENKPDKPENDPTTQPSIPDMIVSIIHNNPSIWPRPPNPDRPSVTIGDTVLPVNTPNPTQNEPNQPNEQSQPTPIVVIGTETFYPGETKTINGIPVVAPTDGGTTRLVVDGTTITVPPAGPTGAPVLTVGSNTVTANSQGQYIIGTQTLNPGGSAITVDGTTYSLGPSGTAIVVNGVTSTLANSGPVTVAPELTINGKSYSATVRDGTTEYVLGEGTTLKPGEAVTISGTTYSLVPEGTALIINGQTSSVSRLPASNSASTTQSSSVVRSSSSSRTTSTTSRDVGDIIASGIGESSRGAGAPAHHAGFDKLVEGMVIGAASWLLMLL